MTNEIITNQDVESARFAWLNLRQQLSDAIYSLGKLSIEEKGAKEHLEYMKSNVGKEFPF